MAFDHVSHVLQINISCHAARTKPSLDSSTRVHFHFEVVNSRRQRVVRASFATSLDTEKDAALGKTTILINLGP